MRLTGKFRWLENKPEPKYSSVFELFKPDYAFGPLLDSNSFFSAISASASSPKNLRL